MKSMKPLAILALSSLLLAAPAWSETCASKPFTLGKPAAKPAPTTRPADPPRTAQAKPVTPPKKPSTVGVAPCKTGQAAG